MGQSKLHPAEGELEEHLQGVDVVHDQVGPLIKVMPDAVFQTHWPAARCSARRSRQGGGGESERALGGCPAVRGLRYQITKDTTMVTSNAQLALTSKVRWRTRTKARGILCSAPASAAALHTDAKQK